MATPTLEEMEERARRYLDGMSVNKDLMARDVLLLTKSIRSAQQRVASRAGMSSQACRRRHHLLLIYSPTCLANSKSDNEKGAMKCAMTSPT